MPPKPISVYIDNDVWDFLFERRIDLAEALPRDEFCVCITREAEFEIPPIPDHKADLKAFIHDTIDRCTRTDSFFGFYDEGHSSDEQRVGGWDIGRWAQPEELAFIRQQRMPLTGKKRKTKLFKNEADISIAARAFTGIVLSLDAKKGPINDAYKQGGKVIFLKVFDDSGLSLSEFIKAAILRE